VDDEQVLKNLQQEQLEMDEINTSKYVEKETFFLFFNHVNSLVTRHFMIFGQIFELVHVEIWKGKETKQTNKNSLFGYIHTKGGYINLDIEGQNITLHCDERL